MPTGYVWEEIYGWHNTGNSAGAAPAGLNAQPYQHFESAESKVRLASALEVSGLSKKLKKISVQPASVDDVSLVHDKEYVELIKQKSASPFGGDAGDGLSPFGTGSYEIALWAAGGAIAAMKSVVSGEVNNVYALIRPPGHHARVETGMGFCIFANAAIAIRYAQKHLGIKKVAVLDWDVHHGNGTQEVFYDDPNVLTISLHQDRLYPRNSGMRDERGVGAGLNKNINIPLPAGTGNGGYIYAFEQVVAPAIRKFNPDLIAVASGFDSCVYDPLGRMMLTASGYAKLTEILMNASRNNKLMIAHEGGYNAVYSPFCGLFVLQQLSGITKLSDPFDHTENYPGQALYEHQKSEVDEAAKLLSELPDNR